MVMARLSISFVEFEEGLIGRFKVVTAHLINTFYAPESVDARRAHKNRSFVAIAARFEEMRVRGGGYHGCLVWKQASLEVCTRACFEAEVERWKSAKRKRGRCWLLLRLGCVPTVLTASDEENTSAVAQNRPHPCESPSLCRSCSRDEISWTNYTHPRAHMRARVV